jgi:uncharacterized protein (TIGR03437 family)
VVPSTISVADGVEVIVEHSGDQAAPVRARTASSAPALFTVTGDSRGQAWALNRDWSVNSDRNPAAKGSIVSLFGTGAGEAQPQGRNSRLAVSVTVGGKPAQVLYAGTALLPVPGVFQVNVRIPPDAPSGAAAVAITVGDATNQQDVTIAVR